MNLIDTQGVLVQLIQIFHVNHNCMVKKIYI